MTERSTPTRTTVEARQRRISQGDTVSARTVKGVASQTARIRTNAAQGAQQAAVKNILDKTPNKAAALKTLLAGSSPEDVSEIRKMLQENQALLGDSSVKPDEELAPNWRSGGYPYKNLLSRKRYEAQKYQLQVELLKLQMWAKDTGQRVVILFEARRSRQGWCHQAVHGAPQPAGSASRGTGKTQRDRAWAMVFPALRAAFAHSR